MLLDNKPGRLVVDALRSILKPEGAASVLASDLSLFGWEAVHAELQELAVTRLLLSLTENPSAPRTLAQRLVGGTEERRLRNSLTAPRVAHLFAAWLRSSVGVRMTWATVPHCLYTVLDASGEVKAIQGSSPLTATGLGLTPSARFEMNAFHGDETSTAELLAFFDGLWNRGELTRDATQELVAALDQIAEPSSPELIYFHSLFHLFGHGLDELDEERIVRTRTGIRDTLVWKKLYPFQRDGVVGAIDKIERYNGCIIADSVGLGKTFEALAIIKYYELRNDRVLVLVPKRLRENWTIYTANDRRNLFAADRFHFDVLNHTDLSRTFGLSGEINLETVNWGNYDLIVIDESHNFRNNPPRRDGLTRYERLMRDVIQSGVKTKVLMLSATPVNNRMNDLKNQVAFITEGEDRALADFGIISIANTLRRAQSRFNGWLKDNPTGRTTESLLDALDFDYFQLLDLLTIARSRKHIVKYYDIDSIGQFPRRAIPVNVKADIDSSGSFPPLKEINRDIRRLTLAAYAPLRYVLPGKVAEYQSRYDIEVKSGSFRQTDREESLVQLMRVNLLKRMESSIHSFAQTVEKLLGKVRGILDRLEAQDTGEFEELSIEEVDLESEDLEPLLVGTKVKVLLQDVDRIRWRQDLEEDEKILVALLGDARQVVPARDEKLSRLTELIEAKARAPFNPGNQKVLVFTAFADTAEYLYEHLADRVLERLGLHSALVTGGAGPNRTTLKDLRRDQSAILGAFSPISKERQVLGEEPQPEIDLLIATDCISEGQNLQDCDYLVNYDIHWNPVRIIQRFGRIDRLGSRNETIQLVNFWPNMELDEYIDLEARVSGRMVLLDISATGEENVIETTDEQDQMNDLAYRRRQFEQLQEQVLDIEDLSDGISITDLTLNDVRQDLARHVEEHGDELAGLPLGTFGAVRLEDLDEDLEGLRPGVFFCLRSESPAVTADSSYPLAPHYMVFVGEDGTTSLPYDRTRRLLDVLKKVSQGRSQVQGAACAELERRTRAGRQMEPIQRLLAQAVQSITGKAEERGVASLFERGGTVLTGDTFRGVDDFEVVAYLVVLGAESSP